MFDRFQQIFPVKYVVSVIVASIVILLLIVVLFMLKAPKISQEAYGQYYTISGVKIPTIGSVLDEERTVSNMVVSATKDEEYKQFTYSNATSIKADIRAFIDCLEQNEGFVVDREEKPDSLMWQVMLSKHIADINKQIVVDINCEVNSYTITLKVEEDI